MGTSPRTHTIPLAGETPRRQAIVDLATSINDIVPAANATARAQILADLTAAGQAPTAARPLYVMQTDTREIWEHNGAAWSPWGLRGYSWVARTPGVVLVGVATMTNILSIALPADAPAGLYQVDAAILARSDAATTHYSRIRVGGLWLDGHDAGADFPANQDVARTKLQTFTHAGGAVTVYLDLQINAGTAAWNRARPDCYLRVTWLGRA